MMTVKIDEIKNRSILIDSCIILYCTIHAFRLEMREVLRILKDNQNDLAISELSSFEVLRKAENKDRPYLIKFLNYVKNIQVNRQVILNSIILSKTQSVVSQKEKKEDIIDYLIGGTVLSAKGALFLTGNIKHFQKPFWKVLAKDYFLYDKGDQKMVQNIYLLEPQIEEINKLSQDKE